MKTSAVVGLGFGDEGKGLATSYLCSKHERSLVVRFQGGHQAGHTVVWNGLHHIFSNFGSGTLQGVPTYWSRFCTINPSAILRELEVLKNKGIERPRLYVDPLCPVVTPFDILYNQDQETSNSHGSVGVGFGTTIERNEKHYHLYVKDLFYENVFIAKLDNIINYYKNLMHVKWDVARESFIESIKIFRKIYAVEIVSLKSILERFDFESIIFEGAQGILLDMDYGFFPNVTRSNCTIKNAVQLIKEQDLPALDVYYVTRAYQTRHGNGYMSDNTPLKLKNNKEETNVSNEWQGDFRTGLLDMELLNYAVACDSIFERKSNNLIVTCLDQLTDGFKIITEGGNRKVVDILPDILYNCLSIPIESSIFSRSPDSDKYMEEVS